MADKPLAETLKFLCSYHGKIVLSRGGQLRYAGGFTRVLAVDRAVSFAELMVKIGEFCGFSATLRCQLPGGDLETLISVTSEEDLANLMEEYARASPAGKIRAVLNPRRLTKTVTPPISATQSVNPASARAKPAPKLFVSAPAAPAKPVGQYIVPVPVLAAPAKPAGQFFVPAQPAPAKPAPGFVVPAVAAFGKPVVPGMAAKRNTFNRCNVGGNSGGILYQHLHHHHHHHHQLRQRVPACYFWQ